ncbi:hypothetical protein BJ508DRAFT_366734 [Ascobolus immersus RN42]|uniref:Uncharacterized protein n=1 Tax=Ascobolus immersus RN42 TaxID=1160509 RepID=A0A3N4HJJ1_ASCIM|nr:hypothetical protein BJ508DRAFT_366734 [Ascobolus immersus RN42]
MAALKPFCDDCEPWLDSDGEIEDHGLECPQIVSTIVIARAAKPSPVSICIFRAKDSYFYCPIAGCDYRESDEKTFRQHCIIITLNTTLAPHLWPIVLKEEVKGRNKRSKDLCYRPVGGPTNAIAPKIERLPSRLSSAPGTVKAAQNTTEASMALSPQGPRAVLSDAGRNTVEAAQSRAPHGHADDADNLFIPPSSPPIKGLQLRQLPEASKKRKAPSSMATGDLRAALTAEYRQRLLDEMMKMMADPDADLDESSKRREKFKAWFEERLKMIEDTEERV